MKWAVFGLVLLGSIAAVCAALLVNAMRLQTAGRRPEMAPTTSPTEVTVLYAKRSLPAMTVVEGAVVGIKSVPMDQLPAKYLSSATDVVGRVLSAPVVEGQPFTSANFSESGGAGQVAAVIPQGKRAVGISVTNYAGLEALLYPGSMVDVLVSLKSGAGADGAKHEAMSATLLENVQVLAIEQQTVVSPGKMADKLESASRSGDTRSVTLLVDTRQAKVLQLGMEQGILSLALRNPLDATSADREAIDLSGLMGRDTRIALAKTNERYVEGSGSKTSEQPKSMSSSESKQMKDPFDPVPMTHTITTETGHMSDEQPHWDTIIIRAGATETKSFAMPAAEMAKFEMK